MMQEASSATNKVAVCIVYTNVPQHLDESDAYHVTLTLAGHVVLFQFYESIIKYFTIY